LILTSLLGRCHRQNATDKPIGKPLEGALAVNPAQDRTALNIKKEFDARVRRIHALTARPA